MAERVDVPMKACAYKKCREMLIRKRYGRKGILEQPTRYAKRKYCGNWCKAGAYRKSAPAGRLCQQCEAPIRRKRWPCGDMETTKQLRRRRFCDVECAALYYEERGHRARFLLRARVRNGASKVAA